MLVLARPGQMLLAFFFSVYIVAAGWALRLLIVIPSGLWPLPLPKDLMQEKSKSIKECVNVDNPKEQE